MLTFQYVARNPSTGQKIKADVQAESEKTAVQLIRKEGLVVLEMKQASAGNPVFAKFQRIPAKDKVLFSRQLSTLINAGLPLVQSLQNVSNQTTNKQFRAVLSQIIADIEGGTPLSVAMSHHPSVFSKVYVSMVAAGEVSGTLDASLQRLADQQEKDADIVSKVRGAMVYPVIVMVVMVAVVCFMLVKVLPQVEVLYAGFPGAKLPFITILLLGMSHIIIKFWWIALVVVGLCIFFAARWVRTDTGRRVIDRVKMSAPAVGVLFRKMYMARFARTGSTLVSSGVPLIQMLEITADAVNNVHVGGSITRAIEVVRGGKSLADALDGDKNFLELVPNMLRIGEQSGSIEKMLDKTASYYEKEVDDQIKNVQAIIEPVMMVMLGVAALIIVAAVLLPVYGLAGKSFG